MYLRASGVGGGESADGHLKATIMWQMPKSSSKLSTAYYGLHTTTLYF